MPTSSAIKQSSDVFSLSDQILSDRVEFVEEIGFGNWGSVWACKPKKNGPSRSAGKRDKAEDDASPAVAVKLVHRSKTKTSEARVKSLWNEMKIIRSLRDQPHPSIIPFHSFVMTPSYALITMSLFRTHIPVEVEEPTAKSWFRSLLSAVLHLHTHGIVHNDIKPANILLSKGNIPVIIDFGFAEKYDLNAPQAFISNLSYGTPEYLAPERASGLSHDTRRSDMWGLGITFFEILVGRTPFEHVNGEALTTKGHLERYWSRTLRGKWVGSWKMSKPVEKLLKRMITPHAELRYTASEATTDPYWRMPVSTAHQRIPSSSSTTSSKLGASVSKLKVIVPPWVARSEEDKENTPLPRNKGGGEVVRSKPPQKRRELVVRFKSTLMAQNHQNAIMTNSSASLASVGIITQPKPNAVPAERHSSHGNGIKSVHKIPRSPARHVQDKLSPIHNRLITEPAFERLAEYHRVVDIIQHTPRNHSSKILKSENTTVRQRVAEWERERQRLRDMERFSDSEPEQNEERARVPGESDQSWVVFGTVDQELALLGTTSGHTEYSPSTSRSRDVGTLGRTFKASFDKTVHAVANVAVRVAQPRSVGRAKGQMMHARTLSEGHATLRTPFTRSSSVGSMSHSRSRSEPITPGGRSRPASWGGNAVMQGGNSSLPIIRHVLYDEQLTAEVTLDKMTIWMRNAEKVVEEACQRFTPAVEDDPPPSALPPSSIRRPRRPSSLQLDSPTTVESFAQDSDLDLIKSLASACGDAQSGSAFEPRCSERAEDAENDEYLDEPAQALQFCPSVITFNSSDSEDDHTSIERRQMSQPKAGFLDRPIASIAELELELAKEAVSPPVRRLSALIDSRIPTIPPVDLQTAVVSGSYPSRLDGFTFPVRVGREHGNSNVLDASDPSQRHIHDLFLANAPGVKRVGRGYQSDNTTPISRPVEPEHYTQSRIPRFLSSARRARPLAFSRKGQRKTFSVDQLNFTIGGAAQDAFAPKDSRPTTLVRRMLNSIVGGATPRRESKLHRLFPSSFTFGRS